MVVMINYLAVLISAIANFVLGGMWYGPLFGKRWVALMGWSKKDMNAKMTESMWQKYLLQAVGSLLMAYVLAYFVNYTGATTALAGAMAGFWVWLGFIATVQLGTVLWEGKSWSLYLLNVAYYLVSLVVMGIILAVWV